ncbi:hypothetical protein QUA27_07830 [Microcoleus sp. Pol14C6]
MSVSYSPWNYLAKRAGNLEPLQGCTRNPLASVKQADKIYIKGPLVSRSDFYLPAQTAVHLLFTFPIKATKKSHQFSWVSPFKRQQQELGGIAGK